MSATAAVLLAAPVLLTAYALWVLRRHAQCEPCRRCGRLARATFCRSCFRAMGRSPHPAELVSQLDRMGGVGR